MAAYSKLTAQTSYPNFKIVNGEVLVRKMYEIVLIDGVAVTVDLPKDGEPPEYLNTEQQNKWFEENKKALDAGKR